MLLHPTLDKLKALKPETLQEIIQMILLKTDSTIVLIGAANDACEGAMLMEKFSRQRVINGAGAFSLVELPELLMRLTLFVSVDSGIAYMADAVNIPVIDIMGPADPSDQRPTGANAIIIKTELPCAPCSHAFRAPYECKIKTRACVNNVDAQRIAGKVIASLVKVS